MNLDNLYSGKDASEMLGKSGNYIRQLYAKYPNRFLPGSCRKIGREFIITIEGIEYLKKGMIKKWTLVMTHHD